MISRQQENPESDFKQIVNNLFSLCNNDEKPQILCSCYFSLPDSNDLNLKNIPNNVFVCPGADLDLDYDLSVKKVNTFIVSTIFLYFVLQAKEIFHSIYTDCEFLPRAPDPEEIIIGEENT